MADDPASRTRSAAPPKPDLLEHPEFTRVGGTVRPSITITSVEPRVKEEVWDPDEHAAKVQSKLAFRLIWVLAGVLLGGAALLSTTKWTGLASKDVTSFFGVAFAAVVTLTTAATSFWFGSQRERSRSAGRNDRSSR